MGTTYEYTYEYEVTDSNKQHRNTGAESQRTGGNRTNYTGSTTLWNRPAMDPLMNLQHDKIWNKLYDPLNTEKASQEAEVQVCRRLFSFETR
jgi:hypothetical protein